MKSAFDCEGCNDPHMAPGITDHGHKLHGKMTGHTKKGQGRGFHKGGSKDKEPQGGGGGMASNMKGNKSTGKTKQPMQSHGEY